MSPFAPYFPYTRLVEFAKAALWGKRRGGVFLILAGIIVVGSFWWHNAHRAKAEAQRILAALGDGEEPSPQVATALVELGRSDHDVRLAFLQSVLASEARSRTLHIHELGVSVAVSQVDYSEAVALYRDAIRPALMSSHQPKVLQECFTLISRWSLFSQISPPDAARLASQLADALAVEREPATLELYSAAIEDLAPRLSLESAGSLAAKLFNLATAQSDLGAARAAIQGLIAVAPRISVNHRRELADALVARLAAERRRPVILVLSPALPSLGATLDPAASSKLAGVLAARIMSEWDPEAIDALIPALRSAAANAGPVEAQQIGTALLQHVKLEPDPAVLLLITQAFAVFGDKLPVRMYEEAGKALLERLRAEGNAGTLSVLAFSLGVLKDKAGGDQFEAASSEIVSRIVKEHDLQTLASLTAAVDPVADDLEPPAAGRLSSLLVTRVMQEYDAGSLLYLAVALSSIADEAGGKAAAALVEQLSNRMRREQRSNVVRSLAFGIAAFKKTDGTFEAPAELLVSRMTEENGPEELRALTSGLYALRDKVSARVLAQAASILAARIESQLTPASIRMLAESLHSLAGKTGPEPFEQAASAIAANVNNLAALEPALHQVSAKLRSEKARELSTILIERIGREQDPDALRVLGQALADLPVTATGKNISPIFEIPDAPCQASHSAIQLLNPLCSESSWMALAAETIHAKRPAVSDDLPPDFTQLAPDDDDVATGPSEDAPSLDFRQISGAIDPYRPARQTRGETKPWLWSGIALLILGVLALVYSSRAQT